jgi:hypothetical protein
VGGIVIKAWMMKPQAGGLPLTGWSYRKSVTLSRASGAVTDYQMKLLVGESSGATGEDVDCGGLCTTDFDDIRFTKSDGTTLLDYWIESITGTTPNQLATIWIEFDSIQTSATTFYMYYGNSGVAAYSNISNTFLFGDDFSTTWNDPVKWTGDTANFSVTSGILTGSTGKIIKGNVYIADDMMLRARAAIANANWGAMIMDSSNSQHRYGVYHDSSQTNHSAWNRTNNNFSYWEPFSTSNIDAGNYHIFTLIRILTGTDTITGSIDDGASIGSATTYVPTLDMGARIEDVTQTDWIFLKTYLAVEPAWGSWGAQES